MLRRLHPTQPDSFAFSAANLKWAQGQITKYPEGRQASAVIPLLWRAQEQEGWLSQPAIENIADMLGMAHIRVLEVATFYFMFQLKPVGSIANIQVCGTTTCMICGAEDLIGVCRERIAPNPHEISADGKFSWEEVECLGSCSNAPMAQIGKDFYEDLSAARLSEILDELANGKIPTPGPQNGRYAAEPLDGLTTLTEHESGRTQFNASVELANTIGDTVKRIDGTEVPLTTPWLGGKSRKPANASTKTTAKPKAKAAKKPVTKPKAARASSAPAKPKMMKAPRKTGADDLKMIKGVGPKLETMLHALGFFHYDQVAAWTKGEVSWVDENLEGFKGRVSRDKWVSQAKTLAKGGKTEFSKRAKY